MEHETEFTPPYALCLQTCRPKLTDEQKAQLRTCFDLMDADGSGAIDAEELSEAFELLGMNYSRAEIQVADQWRLETGYTIRNIVAGRY